MRTSRLSRDTAALVSALSPRKLRPQRAAAVASTASRRTTERHTSMSASPSRSDSSSSISAPSASDSESEATTGDDEHTPAPPSSRKRKRNGAAAGAAPRTTISNSPTLKRAKRTPAKRVVRNSSGGSVAAQAPADWEEVYATTKAMRARRPAPVDTMGCERLAEEDVGPRARRFQTLVSLMLSSQTKDTVNAVAMGRLRAGLPGGFNLEGMLAVEPDKLNELIWQVGFHNTKTKHIKQTAEILRDRFDGDIPDTIEGLVSLPGVGPKMAYLAMSAAWGRDEGIGVDVHVHRITNLWGWHKTKTPEETRAALEAWLPRERWHDINTLLVGFGQTWCPPVGRKCGECGLAQKALCPSAVVDKATKAKWAKTEVKIEVENGEVVVKDEAGVEGTEVKVKELDDNVIKNGLLQDIEEMGAASGRTMRRMR